MNKIYVTSDLHFGHDKPFLYTPRGFLNINDHDEAIIQNWNEIVDEDDIVYILGDLMLGDNKHGIECIERLNGKFHVILGNHDTDARKKLYENLDNKIISVQYATLIKYKKYHLFLSHYPTLTSNTEKDNLK